MNFDEDNLIESHCLLTNPILHFANGLSSSCALPPLIKSLQIDYPNANQLPFHEGWTGFFDLGISIDNLQQQQNHCQEEAAFELLPESIALLQELKTSQQKEIKISSSKSEEIKTNSTLISQNILPPTTTTIINSQISSPSTTTTSTLLNKSYKYAIKVASEIDISEEDFQQLVPKPAHKWPFQLDSFQKHAILCLEQQQSVFIAAHTSAGKTVVAEYAIHLCQQNGTRAIYTSPIKALSNQKYHDFHQQFSDVGLMTGDIQINQNAKCVIMTTEILRCMLYARSDLIHDLEWVIFDEVHYINDPERGVVWEEVLILLPKTVGIILLSATVSNTMDFAEWIGQIKKRPVHVISTLKRPIPLEHYLFCGTSRKDLHQLYLIVDKDRHFMMEGYSKAQDALRGGSAGDLTNKATISASVAKNKAEKMEKGTFKRGGKTNAAGRVQHSSMKSSGGGGASGTGSNSSQYKREETQWLAVIDLLQKSDKLPAVVFLFSKRRINQLLGKMRTVDLLNKTEKHQVRLYTRNWIHLLREEDRTLPQILFLFELLERGLACHHSGILPLLKEMVEILFQNGLVKLLFATETFAMGVNMPARTVIFESIQKFDGTSLRFLNPSEYTQMAGRAGRRGLDVTGTVILIVKPDLLALPQTNEMQKVMLGRSVELRSQFRLTYTMLLNVHRSQTSRAEDMLRFSFIEASELRNTEANTDRLQVLQKIPPLNFTCDICLREWIQAIYSLLQMWQTTRLECLGGGGGGASLNSSSALFSIGRFILFYDSNKKSQQQQHQLKQEETIGFIRCGFWIKLGRRPGSHAIFTYSIANEEGNGDDGVAGGNENTEMSLSNHLKMSLSLLLGHFRFPLQQQHQQPELCEISTERIIGICDRKWSDHYFSLTTNSFNASHLEDISEYFHCLQLGRSVEHCSTSVLKLYQTFYETLIKNQLHFSTDLQFYEDEIGKDNEHKLVFHQWKSTCEQLIQSSKHHRENWSNCMKCTNFLSHIYCFMKNEHRSEEIRKLTFILSDRNLSLLPDYESKLLVLRQMKHLTEKNTVSLKGRIACEVGLHELIVTELLLQGITQTLTPAEMAALMSCFVYEKVNSVDATMEEMMKDLPTEGLKHAIKQVLTIANEVGCMEKQCGVTKSSSCDELLHFGVVPLVYAWGEQQTLGEVMRLGERLYHKSSKNSASGGGGGSLWPEPEEGVIVRCMQRLDELLRHIRSAAKIMGNCDLDKLAEEASVAIRRDIVFAPSLYMQND